MFYGTVKTIGAVTECQVLHNWLHPHKGFASLVNDDFVLLLLDRCICAMHFEWQHGLTICSYGAQRASSAHHGSSSGDEYDRDVCAHGVLATARVHAMVGVEDATCEVELGTASVELCKSLGGDWGYSNTPIHVHLFAARKKLISLQVCLMTANLQEYSCCPGQ